jgi:hypothetical protein
MDSWEDLDTGESWEDLEVGSSHIPHTFKHTHNDSPGRDAPRAEAIDAPLSDEESPTSAAPAPAESQPRSTPITSGVDPFLAEVLLTADRGYVAQWDSELEHFLRDEGCTPYPAPLTPR